MLTSGASSIKLFYRRTWHFNAVSLKGLVTVNHFKLRSNISVGSSHSFEILDQGGGDRLTNPLAYLHVYQVLRYRSRDIIETETFLTFLRENTSTNQTIFWRRDTQPNDTRNDGSQPNDTQHNDTRNDGTQHNDTQATLG